MRRTPIAIIRDVLASCRGETVTLSTINTRANLSSHKQRIYVDGLVEEGYLNLEFVGRRRYPIRNYSLTTRGQKLLLAFGGKP